MAVEEAIGTVAVWMLCVLVFETCREASLYPGEELLLLVGDRRGCLEDV